MSEKSGWFSIPKKSPPLIIWSSKSPRAMLEVGMLLVKLVLILSEELAGTYFSSSCAAGEEGCWRTNILGGG